MTETLQIIGLVVFVGIPLVSATAILVICLIAGARMTARERLVSEK